MRALRRAVGVVHVSHDARRHGIAVGEDPRMNMVEYVKWSTGRYEYEQARGAWECKRCGRMVRYLTKHAATVHGDDIAVMPAVNKKNAKSW